MVEFVKQSTTMRVTQTPEARMRGDGRQQAAMWSYLSLEQRVLQGRPLRPMRATVTINSRCLRIPATILLSSRLELIACFEHSGRAGALRAPRAGWQWRR
jgi:hypothetical protein